jgi:hypothetical protein
MRAVAILALGAASCLKMAAADCDAVTLADVRSRCAPHFAIAAVSRYSDEVLRGAGQPRVPDRRGRLRLRHHRRGVLPCLLRVSRRRSFSTSLAARGGSVRFSAAVACLPQARIFSYVVLYEGLAGGLCGKWEAELLSHRRPRSARCRPARPATARSHWAARLLCPAIAAPAPRC